MMQVWGKYGFNLYIIYAHPASDDMRFVYIRCAFFLSLCFYIANYSCLFDAYVPDLYYQRKRVAKLISLYKFTGNFF
jgi:hypothetical protein